HFDQQHIKKKELTPLSKQKTSEVNVEAVAKSIPPISPSANIQVPDDIPQAWLEETNKTELADSSGLTEKIGNQQELINSQKPVNSQVTANSHELTSRHEQPDKHPDSRTQPHIHSQPVQEHTIESNDNPLTKLEMDLSSFWNQCVYKIACVGMEKEVLLHCCLLEKQLQEGVLSIKLGLDKAHQALLSDKLKQRLEQKLQHYFSSECDFDVKIKSLKLDIIVLTKLLQKQLLTPKQTEKKQLQKQMQQAINSIHADANVQLLIKQFSGKIIPDSIVPLT
ncbi:MAG: DNA polymerase III subunit gamma/tau C-terminal domain-containing protein, partial [Pseudomonadota bacterium]